MLEDFQLRKLGTRAEKGFPLIKDECRDIDQTNHSRCIIGRLRDDEAAIRVADQKRRSFQLRENLTRGGNVVPGVMSGIYCCLTNGICKLVGLFSGLSSARPSTFLLPLNSMSL